MNKFYIVLIVISCSLYSMSSFSQDSPVLSLNSTLINTEGQDIPMTSTVEITETIIEWTQKGSSGATQTESFLISSFTGVWDVSTNTGEISYSTTSNGEPVTIVLKSDPQVQLIISTEGYGDIKIFVDSVINNN